MQGKKTLENYVKSAHYRNALHLPQEQTEHYEVLAQGEYNRNYLFTHPVTGKQLILRVNYGSQMHLEHQIEYEYHALELLKHSGRTPQVYYVDGSKQLLENGVLVMEYLPGHALDYKTELSGAAACLADIHSVPLPEHHGLIHPKDPLQTILRECEEMFSVYEGSDLGTAEKKHYIRELLDLGWKRAEKTRLDAAHVCCINTELNSTNFLMNGSGAPDYLIDWEKPLAGDPAQDLGHFLAPTTTFWKTDVILYREEIETFLGRYLRAVDSRFPAERVREHTGAFIPITCLRGITWCAMAWIQYQQPGKQIFNESTYKKLQAYLDMEFLEGIREYLR